MSDGRKYYCVCDSNCRFETMTKEQILTAIAQAVADGKVSNVDAGFITKVKETNGGNYVTFWVGSQAEYNALPEIQNNCLYIISDETTKRDIERLIANVKETADGALQTAGGTMTGALKTNGIILTYGVDYGTQPPASAVEGKLFIQIDE